MSRINRTPTSAELPHQKDLEELLNSALKQKDAPSSVGFLNAEYLAAAVSVVRQPPALQLNSVTHAHTPIFDQLVNETLDPLTHVSTGQLAYAIAEMTVRREAEVMNGTNSDAKEGLSVLGNMARMFEHLMLMQTLGGAR